MRLMRMVYTLLDRRERMQLVGLAAAMVVIGLAETVGVASVLPFMQLVADPDIILGTGWIADLYVWSGFTSVESALFAAGVAVLATVAFSNGVSALGVWVMSHWAWLLNHRLSTTLLAHYLHRPYSFFLGQNTAELNRTVLQEVGSVVVGVVLPGLQLAARGIAASLVVVLVAVVDARLAATLTVLFGGAYAIVYAFLRRSQRRLGWERFTENGRRFRIAGEALAGIKEVKMLGREDEFLRRFSAPSRSFAVAAARNMTVSRVPRYVLETIALAAILLIVLRGLGTGSDLARVLPVLSLYAFAGYRLMPAFHAIFASVMTIRFNGAALEALHEELTGGGERVLRDAEPLASVALAQTAGRTEQGRRSDGWSTAFGGIELRGVDFRYPGAASPTLTGLDLHIEPNTVVGFVGRTGVGKTTLVDLVLGLLPPTEGQILVNGVVLDDDSGRAWRRSCGYVPQDAFVTDDTVTANIAFGVPEAEIDQAAVEAAARVAQLHDFVAGLPDGYDTIVGERGIRMSGGQRQRIGIARALYTDPELLILDEATSALDGVTESAVLETINSLAHRKTLLVITHRLTTVRACDTIHLLEDGRVTASGSYDALIRRHDGFRALAGELEA